MAGAGGVAAPGLVRLILSHSVATWGGVVAAVGFWVIHVSVGRDVDGATSVSLVVSSDVVVCLVVDDGRGVVSGAVVGAGVAPGAVVVVRWDASVVVSLCSVVLVVVTLWVDVTVVSVPDVGPVLVVTVVGLRVAEVMVPAGGLVAVVILEVTGLIVDL